MNAFRANRCTDVVGCVERIFKVSLDSPFERGLRVECNQKEDTMQGASYIQFSFLLAVLVISGGASYPLPLSQNLYASFLPVLNIILRHSFCQLFFSPCKGQGILAQSGNTCYLPFSKTLSLSTPPYLYESLEQLSRIRPYKVLPLKGGTISVVPRHRLARSSPIT